MQMPSICNQGKKASSLWASMIPILRAFRGVVQQGSCTYIQA